MKFSETQQRFLIVYLGSGVKNNLNIRTIGFFAFGFILIGMSLSLILLIIDGSYIAIAFLMVNFFIIYIAFREGYKRLKIEQQRNISND